MLKVLGNKVLVIPEETENDDQSGIIIPDSAKGGLSVAKVAAIGPDVESIEVGQEVLLPKGDLIEVPHEGIDYIILAEHEVLAII